MAYRAVDEELLRFVIRFTVKAFGDLGLALVFE